MKKLLFFLLFPVFAHADDTALVQSYVASGNLPTRTYNCSGTILLTHSLNLHGSIVNYTSLTGHAWNFTGNNLKIYNGTINGPNATQNPSGALGIYNGSFAHDTVDNVTVTNFPNYGIIYINCNYPVVTNCHISYIGYVGVYFNPSSSISTGGVFENNTINRADQPPTTVSQPALLVRGVSDSLQITYYSIHDNIFIMPVSPTSKAAECFEIRNTAHCKIYNNSFQNGSIGLSTAYSFYLTAYNNVMTGQNQEGLELGNTANSNAHNNRIFSQLNVGALLDGLAGDPTQFDTLKNNKIYGCGSFPVQLYQSQVHDIVIDGDTLTSKTNAIYVQSAYNVTIKNSQLIGTSPAQYAVYSANSPGGIVMFCSTVTNFTNKSLYIYGSTPVNTTGISFTNFVLSGTPNGYTSLLSGGATIGTVTISPVATPAGCTAVIAPDITYANQTFTALTTISPVSPTNTGGTVTTYAVSPTIPAGLTFNTSTGIIAGTPTPHQTAITYTVIATNPAGADTTTFTIAINNPAFTFGTLAGKTYGAIDFLPGGTSPAPITYTSTDSGIAIITGGFIHITGTGIDTIKANNGYQIIAQPLGVSKAALTIAGQNNSKRVGSPNPPLSVNYTGFQYGETPSVLSGGTVTTTAVTGSAAGLYPIVPSGASASNYTITNANGTLIVYPGQGPLIFTGKLLVQ